MALAELLIHSWEKNPEAEYYQGQLRVSGTTYNIRTRDVWLLLPDDAILQLEAYSKGRKIGPIISSSAPVKKEALALSDSRVETSEKIVGPKAVKNDKSSLTAEELAELEADYPEETDFNEPVEEEIVAASSSELSISDEQTTTSTEIKSEPTSEIRLSTSAWTGIGKESVDFSSQTQNFSGSSLAQFFGIGAKAHIDSKLSVFFQAYFNSLKIKNNETSESENAESIQEEASYSIQHLHKDFRLGFQRAVFDAPASAYNFSLGLAMQYSSLPILKEISESSKVSIRADGFYPLYVLAAFKKNWEKLFLEIELNYGVWAQSTEAFSQLTVEPKLGWKFSSKFEAYTSFIHDSRALDYEAKCAIDSCSSLTSKNKITVNALLFGLLLNH